MNNHHEALLRYLAIEIDQPNVPINLLNDKSRLNLFYSNYSHLFTAYFDSSPSSDSFELNAHNTLFVECSIKLCRLLVDSSFEVVSFDQLQNQLIQHTFVCLIRSKLDQQFDDLIKRFFNNSNIDFFDKITCITQLADKLTDKTQATILLHLCVQIAYEAFRSSDQRSTNNQATSRVVHALINLLQSLANFLSSFPVLLNELKCNLQQLAEKEADQHELMCSFSFELLACLSALLTDDKSTLDTCWNLLKQDSIFSTVVQDAILDNSNAIRRKRARHTAVTLNWIDLKCWQILESLEESQVHLCKPVLDNLLPAWNPSSSGPMSMTQPEIVVRRMFDHTNKAIKRYAFNFLSQLYESNEMDFYEKITKEFFFEHIFDSLQDNQIYGDGLPDETLSFLTSCSINSILSALLQREYCLSPYSLYYVSKALAASKPQQIKEEAFKLDSFLTQRLFQSIQRVCAEPIVRAAIQIQLLIAVCNRLQPTTNCDQFISLLTLIGSLNLKEIKNNALDLLPIEILSCVDDDLLQNCNLSDIQIAGLARLLGNKIEFSHTILTNGVKVAFDQWQSSVRIVFIKNLFSTLPQKEVNLHFEHLVTFNVLQNEFFANLSVLFRKLDLTNLKQNQTAQIQQFVEMGFELNPFESFRSIVDLRLNQRFKLEFQNKIAVQLQRKQIKFDLLTKSCWVWLFEHLNCESKPIWTEIKYIFESFFDSNDKFENTLDLIQIVPIHFNSHVIRLFGKLLSNEVDRLTEDSGFDQFTVLINFGQIFNSLFKSCLELRKKEFYRQTFYVLISEFAYSESLFRLNSSHLERFWQFNEDDRLDNFDQVESPEVQAYIVEHLCRLAGQSNSFNLTAHLSLFVQIVQRGLLFERKQLNLMQMLIERVANQTNLFELIESEEDPNFHRNVRMTAILTALFVFPPKLNTFLTRLITCLIEKENELLNEEGVKSFPHSKIHRQQTKIWQFFALCSSHNIRQDASNVNEQIVHTLYEHAIQSIFNQTAAQLSVRHVQSILLIDLLQSKSVGNQYRFIFNQTLQDQLDNRNSGVGCFQTLLSVCYHLLPQYEQFKSFAIGCLLSCHHYRVRLFAHLVMSKLEHRLQINLFENKQSLFSTSPKAAANFTKNLKLLQSDWFFAHLNVQSNLSWQLLVEQCVRLTDCLRDDWLFIDQFDGLLQKSPLPVKSNNVHIDQSEPSHLFDRNFDHPTDSIDPSEQAALFDIFQRKCLIPVPDQPLASVNTSLRGNLIVCASLVDRAPNLGGLSRTCEIFGVNQLILPNLCFVQDKEFQGLSVSAYKWLPMNEVPVNQLINYLTIQRNCHGYKLIGVEQSTGSVCLTKFTFPEKSLLVLGNEKEGLSAQLLQMMDFCIEIPQCGQTRSLNVHVTGAICSWEYLKQHRNKYTLQ